MSFSTELQQFFANIIGDIFLLYHCTILVELLEAAQVGEIEK